MLRALRRCSRPPPAKAKRCIRCARRLPRRNGKCRRRGFTTPCTTPLPVTGASRRGRARPRPACAPMTRALARPLLASFGAALVLTPEASGRTSATFEMEFLPGEEKPARMSDSALEELRLGIPAARALPLFEALARKTQGDVVLDFLTETRLRVSVSPC